MLKLKLAGCEESVALLFDPSKQMLWSALEDAQATGSKEGSLVAGEWARCFGECRLMVASISRVFDAIGIYGMGTRQDRPVNE